MPQTNISYLPKSEVKIEFVVTLEEAKPYLDEAVVEISTAKPLPGFRPGKATYEDVKRAHGEMTIWQGALERIVRAFYVKTILNEQIDTVGSPAVSIDQLTPGQDIKFTITAPIEPKVLEFPDLTKCQVSKKPTEIKDADVNDAIEQMRKMRRSEALVDRPATEEDLVVIDLEMKKDHVALDGGTGKGHRVYMTESHYIPGFTKELVGIKAGDERTFTLKFPEEHYQKHLSGQDVDFTVKATGVYELAMPTVDDEFAKGVGIESLEALRARLKENLGAETEQRHVEAAEIEMLEKLTDAAKFSDIPELLVNQEVRRMIQELEQGVEEQGMKWNDYLTSIKKSADELKLDFLPQAMRRIKTAVLIKQFAKKQDISVSEDELDTEIDRILSGIRESDSQTRERVSSPDYREYVSVQMRNRKTLEWIRKTCII